MPLSTIPILTLFLPRVLFQAFGYPGLLSPYSLPKRGSLGTKSSWRT